MSPSQSLRCVKCGTRIPIPDEVTRTGAGSVVCASCGQRYTRRTGGPSPAGAAPPTTPPRSATAGGPVVATPSGPTRPLGGEAGAPVFAAGTVVGGRYRIVRFLARGGMGEVYEAEDSELRERLALKTIHPAVAAEAGAVERFKREIHLARRVTHPNVCRIFDVGYHASAPGAEPIVFLTMELLEGETLAARLKRAGRLSAEAALPIARQMGAALEAAHAAGVVHRDFKSENVFLVPGPGGERAVVTDFGIARGGGSEDAFTMTLTAAGGVVGTPAYMAPEQVAGEPITPAVDQFALGVVVYEMLAGELPFRGDTPLSTAAKRLTEPPPPLAGFAPDLDPRWGAALERALARRAEDRFASVAAFLAALESESAARLAAAAPRSAAGEAGPSVSAEPPPTRASPKQRRERALAALLLVALAGASFWAYLRVQSLRDRTTAVRPAAARRAVAVLAFENLSGRPESAWLGTALGEMLATELAQGGELRVVPGAAVARAELDLGLGAGERPSVEARERLRAQLAADYLIAGGYTALPGGGPVRLDLRLEDARAGETALALAESGAESELFELVARAGAKLRERLGATARGASLASLFPSSNEAARLYVEGLDAQRRFDPQRAQELLARAVELEPDHALARSALATAWAALGFGDRATAEARRAFELARQLPAPERLVVEARYYESAGEWRRAAEIWQALWSSAPDAIDYGLALARARTAAGEPDAALAAVESLRRLPGLEAGDPRLDLAEAEAATARSDFPRQAAAAEQAAARAEGLGARRLATEALISRAWALRQLGEPEEALRVVARARELAGAAGDQGLEAAAGSVEGSLRMDRGDLAGAASAFESALALCRARGDRGGTALALNNLAVVRRRRGESGVALRQYREAEAVARETGNRRGAAYASANVAASLAELGQLPAALERLEQALAEFRALSDPAGVASALASLGGVRRRLGDLRGARAALEESLAGRRSIGERAGEAGALAALAQVHLDAGELDRAEPLLEESLALARSLVQKSAEAAALGGLGELAAARGDLAGASGRWIEALALRRATGEPAAADRLRLMLARWDGDRAPESAAATAREVLGNLPAEPAADLEASARLVLARAALARGRAAEARRELEPVLDRAGDLGLGPGLELRIVAARAEAAGGRRRAALEELARVAAEAAAEGLLPLETEARLGAAELGGAQERAALAAVAARARAAGLAALAGRAEALAGKPARPAA